MKLFNIKDLDGFMFEVKNCKGEVELVSKYGDRLSLKSKLTQYIAFSKLMFESDPVIREMEIVVHNEEDLEKLIKYSSEREIGVEE